MTSAVLSVYALGYYLSNIYQHSVTVSEAQLMTISPAPSTTFPEATITGQAFNITVDVENPNPVALKGRILVTFTRTGITSDSVDVTSTWSSRSGYQLWVEKRLEGATLSFKLYPNYLADPYFTFQPGSNNDVVYFTVVYQVAGTYDVAMAVVTG